LACTCQVAFIPARADEVWMKNGDRLTGALLYKADDILVLRTGYAGEIRLQWSQVERLSTDRPVGLLLSDETYLKARLAAADASRVALEEKDAPRARDVPLERIAYINPSPEQSGRGASFSGRVQLAAAQTKGNIT
jgi:hypothetical protein